MLANAIVALGGLAACSKPSPGIEPARTVAPVGAGAFHPDVAADLATLRERSRPKAANDIATNAFNELLTLRDRPDEAAREVLVQILEDHAQSSQTLRYAAAQALFAIGSDEALRALESQALRPGFDGRRAFDYAFHWDMDPGRRDGFIESCVLRNAGEAPTIELRRRDAADGSPPALAFDVTVRNDLDHPIEILDPAARQGELLVFRAAEGRVAQTIHPGTCEHMGAGSVRLEPGESRSLGIEVGVIPARDASGAYHGEPPEGATIAARCGSYYYLLARPGTFDVVARWTSATGRSVSAPVRVEVEPGR